MISSYQYQVVNNYISSSKQYDQYGEGQRQRMVQQQDREPQTGKAREEDAKNFRGRTGKKVKENEDENQTME